MTAVGYGPRARLVAAFAALALAWIAVPGAVPLYDGINFPDEPYRYVSPPPGYQHTPKAGSASGGSAVDSGSNAETVYVNTDEQAPQIIIVIPGRLVQVGPAARTMTVSAVPIAPDRQPSKGKIDGNVYRVSAISAPPGPVTWAPPPGDASSASELVLRATSAASPAPVFLYRAQPALAWQVLPTFRFGNDVYRAVFAGFGDYALAFGVVAPAKGSDAWVVILVSVLLVVLVAVVGAVVAVRVSRRPAQE